MRAFVRRNKFILFLVAFLIVLAVIFSAGSSAKASTNKGNDTFVYSYTPIDSSKPGSWTNSGVQTLTPFKNVGQAQKQLCGVWLQKDVVKAGTVAPATISPPAQAFGDNLVSASHHETKPCADPEPPVKPEEPARILINGPVVTETIDCDTLTVTSVTSNEYNVWEFDEDENAWVDGGKTVVETDEPVVTTVTYDVAVNMYDCPLITDEPGLVSVDAPVYTPPTCASVGTLVANNAEGLYEWVRMESEDGSVILTAMPLGNTVIEGPDTFGPFGPFDKLSSDECEEGDEPEVLNPTAVRGSTPEAIAALPAETRALVEGYARSNGIAPESVLVEMG